MDSENELKKAKWVLIVGALFLVSCFMCYDELAYQISGREATATVTKSYASQSRRGTRQTVEYAWSEPEGLSRKAMYTTSPDEAPVVGAKFPVRYTAGDTGRSRRVGAVPWVWIAIFFGSFAAVGVFGFMMWREANDADRPRTRGGAEHVAGYLRNRLLALGVV